MRKEGKGFTLIELLVVISIIGLLITTMMVAIGPYRKKARDVKRQFEIGQIGRFLTAGSCHVPDGGPGEYDLAEILEEMVAANPQVRENVIKLPRDPKGGKDSRTLYYYVYAEDGGRGACAVYANLENAAAEVNLTNISVPTPGRGTGVFRGTEGWNGTDLYYQYGN